MCPPCQTAKKTRHLHAHPGETNLISFFYLISEAQKGILFCRVCAMPSSAAAGNQRRRRSRVVLQDVDLLKAQRLKVKQELKEMSRNLKLQLQKKKRIMKAANLLDDEDLHWVLRERANLDQRNDQNTTNTEQNNVTTEQNAE